MNYGLRPALILSLVLAGQESSVPVNSPVEMIRGYLGVVSFEVDEVKMIRFGLPVAREPADGVQNRHRQESAVLLGDCTELYIESNHFDLPTAH